MGLSGLDLKKIERDLANPAAVSLKGHVAVRVSLSSRRPMSRKIPPMVRHRFYIGLNKAYHSPWVFTAIYHLICTS